MTLYILFLYILYLLVVSIILLATYLYKEKGIKNTSDFWHLMFPLTGYANWIYNKNPQAFISKKCLTWKKIVQINYGFILFLLSAALWYVTTNSFIIHPNNSYNEAAATFYNTLGLIIATVIFVLTFMFFVGIPKIILYRLKNSDTTKQKKSKTKSKPISFFERVIIQIFGALLIGISLGYYVYEDAGNNPGNFMGNLGGFIVSGVVGIGSFFISFLVIWLVLKPKK